jgi:hypothetical protein
MKMDDAGKFAVQVTLSNGCAPSAFTWRNRVYRIQEVQECWRLVGAWWDGECEQTFFRVRTDKGGIYELRFDHGRSAWTMTAVD